VIVAVNLSGKPIDDAITLEGQTGQIKVLYGISKPRIITNIIAVHMPAYGVEVWGM